MISILVSLFLGTFVLEDVAIISALTFVAAGKISLFYAALVCFFGIAIGDLIIYGFGYGVFKFQSSIKFLKSDWLSHKLKSIDQSKIKALVFICRFIPGTRLTTYLCAGYIQYSFASFFVLTIVSVFLWIALVFSGGIAIIDIFQKNWFIVCISLLIGLFVIKFLIQFVTNLFFDPWSKKLFKVAFLKWTSFEFWPAWFFYPPVLVYYLCLAIRHRSFFLPMYANPSILNGGFVGESKWDFYKHFLDDSKALQTILIKKDTINFELIQNILNANKITFPFILKPDVGQRGFGVRIIKSKADILDYLPHVKFDLIIQQYCDWQNEAGIFYYRMPNEQKGHIFSITDKKFPYLIGDGNTKLADLILKDKRARIIANTYFERHKDSLNQVIPLNEKIYLSECGNHCQGAIFLNGKNLMTQQLLDSIEHVAKKIPNFYIGRFDIRYESKQALMSGENYKIIEINGSGSEATHIWDPETKLMQAYQVLFKQWAILFQIGKMVKKLNLQYEPIKKWQLVKDIFELTKKEKSLVRSS